MGVHTGDSITVAPAQTLTDKEYQRDARRLARHHPRVGVETGGSNIQFAVNPDATARMVVIEMNPRVSRSSALASKATGFPIAKIAAKLAVGYTLDELRNDITGETPACFEPAIDYCVVKIPRWTFEKFPEADETLTTQMKSVGEAMAIGRTFKEALQKAVRSLEQDRLGTRRWTPPAVDLDEALRQKIRIPNAERCFALCRGLPPRDDDPASSSRSARHRPLVPRQDPRRSWSSRRVIASTGTREPRHVLRQAKQLGFADARLAELCVRRRKARSGRARLAAGIRARLQAGRHLRRRVRGHTPYLYSTYEEEDEAPPTPRDKVVILGGGPNRIGQGIEFDYCCVHAAFALKEAGFEAIMVNCNPETVSTDYDTSDRLYFEPLTLEDVLNIVEREQAARGHRPVRRPDPAQARVPARAARGSPSSARRRCHRSRRGPRALRRAPRQTRPRAGRPARRPRSSEEAGASPTASATPCSCAPPTCWAAAPWRSSTTGAT